LAYYSGKTAVITGAGSGIGRCLAVQLAAEQAALALLDKDAGAAADTAAQCRRAGARARDYAVDVTDRLALLECATSVLEDFGGTGLLFCAAGVIHTGSLLASDFSDIDRVIAVNLGGTVNTLKAFLPHVIASGAGNVVTFSSGFGIIAAPNYTAYNASKFAVGGLSEALRLEMASGGHPVSVTCVYPGAVQTPIVRSGTFAADVDSAAVIAGFGRLARRTTADQAAAVILRSVRQGKGRAYVGMDARLAALLARVAGGAYPPVASWAISRRRRPARSSS
jgi:short-subunit dehydrogenase